MRVRKNTNGSVPRLANGGAQKWASTVACCCGEGCSNTTGCTGDYVLTSCTGYRFTLPTYTSLSGTVTADSDGLDRISDPPSTFFYLYDTPSVAGSVSWASSLDGLCDYAFSLTLTAPPTTAFASPTDDGATGFYRRLVVNGNSYTFDAMGGIGVSKSFSATRVSLTGSTGPTSTAIPAGYGDSDAQFGSNATATSPATTFSDGGLLYESEDLTITVGRSGNASPFGYVASVALAYSSYRTTQREVTYDLNYNTVSVSLPPNATDSYTVLEKAGWAKSYTVVGGNGYPGIDGVSGIDDTLTCDNTEKTFDIDYELSRSASESNPGIVSGSAGTASMQLAASFTEDEIGCRDCNRVLDLSGTITHQVVEDYSHPGWIGDVWDDETYPDGPMLGEGLIVGSLSLEARIVQNPVYECTDQYGCVWANSPSYADTFATITPPVGDPYDATVSLTRLGPELWRLSVSGVEDPIYLKFSGDCPTGSPTVCQSLNPHDGTTSVTRNSTRFYYQTRTLSPGTDGWYQFGSPIAGPLSFSDVADVPVPTLDPNYDNWITEHAFTFSSGTASGTDPTYYCDEDCASAADDYAADILCGDGDPPDGAVALTFSRVTDCHWEADNGTYTATLDWDSGTWSIVVTRISDSVEVFTASWSGSSNAPEGSHGFGFSVWDEDPCTAEPGSLRVEIS